MCELAEFETDPNFDVYTKNKACFKEGAACIDYVEVHLRRMPVIRANGAVNKEDFIFKVPRGTAQYSVSYFCSIKIIAAMVNIH